MHRLFKQSIIQSRLRFLHLKAHPGSDQKNNLLKILSILCSYNKKNFKASKQYLVHIDQIQYFLSYLNYYNPEGLQLSAYFESCILLKMNYPFKSLIFIWLVYLSFLSVLDVTLKVSTKFSL